MFFRFDDSQYKKKIIFMIKMTNLFTITVFSHILSSRPMYFVKQNSLSILNKCPIYDTYHTNIRFFPLPKQEIKVVLKNDNMAELHLKGVVNMIDSFSYKYDNKKWEVVFNTNTNKMLRKFKCRVSEIDFTNNIISLSIYLPIIGNVHVSLLPEKI